MNKAIFILAGTLLNFWLNPSGRAQSVEDTLDYKIQFGSYKYAARAVSEASANHNIQSLILGLKHPNPDVRAESAKAIGLLNAQQAIPELIEAWGENRRPLNGGTGIQVAQANLDQILATVLANLTNQMVNTQRKLTEFEMKSVVKSANNWMSARVSQQPRP